MLIAIRRSLVAVTILVTSRRTASIHFDGGLRSSESAFRALPLCEMDDFSSEDNSPQVLPSPSSGMKIGSYPNPISPDISSDISPLHIPEAVTISPSIQAAAIALNSASLPESGGISFRIPGNPMELSTYDE